MIGALSGHAAGGDGGEVMAELARSLVPAAEQDETPEALALLRVLAAIGTPEAAGGGSERGATGQRPGRARA